MSVLIIAGGPSRPSASSVLVSHLWGLLEGLGSDTRGIALRDIPADDLIGTRHCSNAARIIRAKVEAARAVIISTPVLKSSLGGGLKALLDLLPDDAFAGKIVLPVATGNSYEQLLALEYGLKPVLSALGARHILAGIYAVDEEIVFDGDDIQIADAVQVRLADAIEDLIQFDPPTLPRGPVLAAPGQVWRSGCCS